MRPTSRRGLILLLFFQYFLFLHLFLQCKWPIIQMQHVRPSKPESTSRTAGGVHSMSIRSTQPDRSLLCGQKVKRRDEVEKHLVFTGRMRPNRTCSACKSSKVPCYFALAGPPTLSQAFFLSARQSSNLWQLVYSPRTYPRHDVLTELP